MTMPEYDEECDCALCKQLRERSIPTKLKAKGSASVRSQISTKDQMDVLFKKIENLVYAAEVACHSISDHEYHCALGRECPFKNIRNPYFSCRVDSMRSVMGERPEQHDIPQVELKE